MADGMGGQGGIGAAASAAQRNLVNESLGKWREATKRKKAASSTKPVDWSYNGDTLESELTSIPTGFDNSGEPVRMGLMDAFSGGGSLLYEPAKFFLSPLIGFIGEPLAEKWSIVDLTAGKINQINIENRLATTIDDYITEMITGLQLSTALRAVGGGTLAPTQTAPAEKPVAPREEKPKTPQASENYQKNIEANLDNYIQKALAKYLPKGATEEESKKLAEMVDTYVQKALDRYMQAYSSYSSKLLETYMNLARDTYQSQSGDYKAKLDKIDKEYDILLEMRKNMERLMQSYENKTAPNTSSSKTKYTEKENPPGSTPAEKKA